MVRLLVTLVLLTSPGMSAAQTGDLQAQFAASVRTTSPVLTASGQPVPGATITTAVRALDSCRTEVTLSRPAVTFQGQTFPAAQLRKVIEWRNATIAYEQKQLVIIWDGRAQISIPAYDVSSDRGFALQRACGAFSIARRPTPAGAPPRWAQVQDPRYKAWMACSYLRLPGLMLEERWGGSRFAQWTATVGDSTHVSGYSQLAINFARANNVTKADEIFLRLSRRDGKSIDRAISRVDLLRDGKAIGSRVISNHDSGDLFTRWPDGEVDGLVAKMNAGQRLVARAFDASNRLVLEETFDLRPLRNVPRALDSTDWNCLVD